ncbi:MAG: hypothetical protein ABH873_07900 [Candidatus Firestonebacteria bacterium]
MRKMLCVIVCLFWVSIGFSAVPQLINYSGKLTDKNGNPITGTKTIVFSMYDTEASVQTRWTGTYPVTVTKGVFNVLLGSGTYPFQSDLDFSINYWLEMKVESETLSPRQRITSVAYAMRSEYSNRAEVVNTPMVYMGCGDIDSNVSEKCYIHLEKVPKTIKMYLWGEKFNTQYYTELGAHVHTGDGTTSGQNQNHVHVHTHNIILSPVYGATSIHGDTNTGGSTGGLITTESSSVANVDHTHSFYFTIGSTGVNAGSVSTVQKTYLNDMKVYLDGENLSNEITSTLLSLSGLSKLGMGTGTPEDILNTNGTGSMNITSLQGLATTGQHYFVFKQSGTNTGGRIRYNIYVYY